MKCSKSVSIESQIRQYTDEYTLQTIEVAKIDQKRSLQSQNRRAIKLDDDNVIAIALAEGESGIVTPPIIVNKVGDKYLVIDGNHRTEARRLNGKDTICAYVVEVDSDTYEKMCIQGNAFNGKALSYEERLEHALALVALGEPASIVAPRWGFREDILTRHRRANEGRIKASSAGISKRLTDRQAEIVNRMEAEHIRILGSEIVGATAADLDAAQKAIAATPSEHRKDEALRQAGRLEQRRQERKQPRVRNKPRVMTQAQARSHLRQFLAGVRENPSIWNDTDVRNLLLDIVKEAKSGEAQRAA